MSEFSAAALREKSKAKAERMASGDPHAKVDASSWTPPEPLNTTAKTGMRPVSRQARATGGKTVARADRKPRATGGGLVNDWINRNDKDANQLRAGVKHRGALATGGTAGDSVPKTRFEIGAGKSRLAEAAGLKRGGHTDEAADRALIHKEFSIHDVRKGNKRPHKGVGGVLEALSPAAAIASGRPEMLSPLAVALGAGKKKDREAKKAGGSVSDGTIQGTRPTGGRMARKSGGRAGKTDINIVIDAQPPQQPAMPIPPPMPPMPPPAMAGPPKPPPGAMPPPGAPPAMAAPMPMPRKAGGRTYRSYKDMDAGAMSGLGRLEKTEIQKRKG